VGSGRFAAPLGITIGLEPSGALSRLAQQRGIDVIRGLAEYLPFHPDAFRSVLMVTVLCFLDDPVRAFTEVHRILEPGGFLYLAFIERNGVIAHTYLREADKGRFLSHARFFSRGEVAALASGAGFALTETDCFRGFCILALQKTDR
jgi:SAM-dependent methyltransferase